jgi:DNA-binding beta-propeller fold protein YncE
MGRRCEPGTGPGSDRESILKKAQAGGSSSGRPRAPSFEKEHAMKTLALLAFALPAAALAKPPPPPCLIAGQHPPCLIGTITVPGRPLTSFDISWVDQPTETYFLADRSNAAVDIFDAEQGVFVTRVPGFSGFHGNNDFAGPNGLLEIHSLHEVWAGNGDSTVKVIDLEASPPRIVDSISTHGTARADEMAFDERDHLLLVANDADSPPFISFISTETHEVVGRIDFPRATNGLEQPVWDAATRLFYLSVPELDGNPATGEIAVIEPRTEKVVDHFPVSECEPAGLVLGPDQHLLVGCSQDAITAGFAPKTLVLDARTGATVATIREVGGSDEVWFNKGDGRYYLAARGMKPPVLGVIDARTNTFVGKAPTARNAHSVAADRKNNHVFVPLTPNTTAPNCATGCIGIYTGGEAHEDDGG